MADVWPFPELYVVSDFYTLSQRLGMSYHEPLSRPRRNRHTGDQQKLPSMEPRACALPVRGQESDYRKCSSTNRRRGCLTTVWWNMLHVSLRQVMASSNCIYMQLLSKSSRRLISSGHTWQEATLPDVRYFAKASMYT